MAGEALATTIKDPVNPPASKKRRNLPGTPDPEAEVIALSPKSLLATNRFICEICGKGFQRDQNLQLHRRGHNLPWKLKQRGGKDARKRVYVCPERGCVHHHPSRALGDLTGIKKHYCRKHGEKRWKCERCSKRYAVQSDWKAHMKTCGTREYRCDCGTVFSRRDSFITHRAFCDALAEETARISAVSNMSTLTSTSTNGSHQHCAPHPMMKHSGMVNRFMPLDPNAETLDEAAPSCLSLLMGQSPDFALLADPEQLDYHLGLINYGNRLNPNPNFTGSTASVPSMYSTQQQRLQPPGDMSATALLQKAAQIGVTCSHPSLVANCSWRSVGDGGDLMEIGGLTRDFLGVGVPTLCPPAHIHGWI